MKQTIICEESPSPTATEEVEELADRIRAYYRDPTNFAGELAVKIADGPLPLLDEVLDARSYDSQHLNICTAFASAIAGQLATHVALLRHAEKVAAWSLVPTDDLPADRDPTNDDGRASARVYVDVTPADLARERIAGTYIPIAELEMYAIGIACRTCKAEYYLPSRACVTLVKDAGKPCGFIARSVEPVVYRGLTPIDDGYDFLSLLEQSSHGSSDDCMVRGAIYRYMCEPEVWPYDVTYVRSTDLEDPYGATDIAVIDEGPGAEDGLRHVAIVGNTDDGFSLEVTRNGRIANRRWWEAQTDNNPCRFASKPYRQVLSFSRGPAPAVREFERHRPQMASFVSTFIGWVFPERSE